MVIAMLKNYQEINMIMYNQRRRADFWAKWILNSASKRQIIAE